jgi:C-terminal processing protease CtpA/Prc
MLRRSLLVLLIFSCAAIAQTYTRQNIANIFGFENNAQAGSFPAGWSGTTNNTIVADNQVAHSGKWSARFERTASSTQTFSTITQAIPLDFAGKTIVWRGWVKMQNVADSIALWAREDDAGGQNVQFTSMQSQGVRGTADWTQYSISIPWDGQAQFLYVGFFLSGPGQAWVDDLELLADGVPVAQAPNKVVTPLDTDHQFDGGSGIQFTSLSDIQLTNLATLAKVWGFVKYHHPAVTGGQHNWDYDLFRVMPQVLAAPDQATARAAMLDWLTKIGPVPPCTRCVVLDTGNLALSPGLDWLADTSLLGAGLSQALQNIYANRVGANSQFYLSFVQGASNPSFDHELTYGTMNPPDAGFRLLALFRFWNMVQYFYPNRAIMSDDPSKTNYWDQVLTDSIRPIGLAADTFTYQQELIRFIAGIHDTHANLWSTLAARPPYGTCYLPVDVRFVEGSAFVLRNTGISVGPASGLLPGDVIEQLDGANVSDLVAQWAPLYADSNQAARMRDIAQSLTRGTCGPASVTVRRAGGTVTLQANRLSTSAIDFSQSYTHDLPGPAFQMLAPDVAYVKISTLKRADCAADIGAAAGTKGLIIDLRNYPSDFPVFTLGGMLVTQPTPFARFTFGDASNPGAFRWADPVSLIPLTPHYSGRVVILVDETTQSSAEYHTLAFRQVPGAMVLGSTTAGADGDVSTVPIPGGHSSYISGIGVFYPDKTPTQRVGIVPDLWVTPTIAGLRAGRDELIEEAIRQIRRRSLPSPVRGGGR